MAPFLEMHGISKSFPGVKALDRVDLTLNRGEVLGLVGENGAGKSTLMKIMTGVYEADTGDIRIDGQKVSIRDPEHARELGLSIIYQELSMVENLTVAENIFLAREYTSRFGFVDSRKMNREATRVLDILHLGIDPATPVRNLSVGQKQMIEIAKAISGNSKIIVMDEPTASLSHHEAETLLAQVKRLREKDIGIVYITHRLEEVFDIADRVTVLRDGRTVETRPIGEVNREHLVRKMVDRELSQLYGEHICRATDKIVLSVQGLNPKRPTSRNARIKDSNFDLKAGEILGFFGLVGAGRTEIMEMLFGMAPYQGEIRIDGERVDITEPSKAIELGLGFVTEDRKEQGLVLDMTVRENFSLTHLGDYCAFDFVNETKEGDACAVYVRDLGIKTPSIEQKARNLSGGNQQKIVIAKWVARNPRILIVDEPTRGIDIGAKAEVHALLRRVAEKGVGIIMISSDLPEVLAVSDRIVVLKEGRISGELERANADQERVMELATG
jgi:ribose transport system ATP-binding protein